MQINKRKLLLGTGFLFLLFVLIETFLMLGQPSYSSGVCMSQTFDGYMIDKVVEGSGAEKSGITKSETIVRINDAEISSWDSFLDIFNFSSNVKKSSEIFRFENTIELYGKNGEKYEFVLERQNFFKRLQNVSFAFILRLLVSVFTVLSGIIFSKNYSEKHDKGTTFLIMFLYFSGFGVINTFANIFDTPLQVNFSFIAFDICAAVSIKFLLLYFSNELECSKIKIKSALFFRIFSYIPLVLIFVKYILKFFVDFNTASIVFSHLVRYIIAFYILIVVFFQISIIMRFPKQISILFRFVMLSVFCAFTPILLFYIKHIIFENSIVTYGDQYFLLLSFMFCPLLSLFSIVQGLGNRMNKFVKYVSIFISFAIFMKIILGTFASFCDGRMSSFSSYIFILISPCVYIALLKLFNAFFSSSSFRIDKSKYRFHLKLKKVGTVEDVFKVTADELIEHMDSSFVFFQAYHSDGKWDIPYVSRKDITDNFINQLVENANLFNSRKTVIKLPYDCLCIPFYHGDSTFCRIFIGCRRNRDEYMAEELGYMESIAEDFYQAFLYFNNLYQIKVIQQKEEKLLDVQTHTIVNLANLIESREVEPGKHIQRVCLYSKALAEKARKEEYEIESIDDDFVNQIEKAAALHDIGKIIVPDNVLKKPSKLDAEEYNLMIEHVNDGSKIIERLDTVFGNDRYHELVKDIVRFHHECWNGSGYPGKFCEKEIPVSARIVAIADVFDALTSRRCYKEPVSIDEGFEVIKRLAGFQFDPTLAFMFVEIKQEISEIFENTENL